MRSCGDDSAASRLGECGPGRRVFGFEFLDVTLTEAFLAEEREVAWGVGRGFLEPAAGAVAHRVHSPNRSRAKPTAMIRMLAFTR